MVLILPQKKPDYCRAFLSGWQDSNLRPPHPKCGAIPGYATPRKGITFFVWHKDSVNFNFVNIFFYFQFICLITCLIFLRRSSRQRFARMKSSGADRQQNDKLNKLRKG